MMYVSFRQCPSVLIRLSLLDPRHRSVHCGRRLTEGCLINFAIHIGSVVLSGFFNAARLASSAAGTPISEHRVLFFGAGSAGIGVAKQLMSFFTLLGLSEDEAKKRIYVSPL